MKVSGETRLLLTLGGLLAAAVLLSVVIVELQPEREWPKASTVAGPAAQARRTPPKDDWRTELEAKALCRGAVRNSLKAPSTADFVSMTAKETTPGRWTVGGQVDAQNSFGAMIRSYYVCEAVQVGTGWRVERLEVE